METLYRALIIIAVALLSQAAFAQNAKLSGKLHDEKSEAIPYVNVAVFSSADSSLLTGATTDFGGKFMISCPAAGTYFLKISGIGYQTKTTAAFTVTGPAFTKDFGTITLKEDVEMLQTVQVEALRPIITTEADKMVVSVEGTALAAGSTAFDVLSKSPGVWVDQDGNIQFNGKAGVKVMIDGRPTYLSAKELQSMLAGMSAENIKNIEIIANPSAKWEAEGTSGILNINLKKNTLGGMNGSMYAGYQFNNLHTYSGGGTLNFKKRGWNSFLNLDVAKRNSYRDMIMIRDFKQPGDEARFVQDGNQQTGNYTPSLSFGADYDLNSRHSLGFNAALSQNNSDDNFIARMQLQHANSSEEQHIRSVAQMDDRTKRASLNLHYLGKLDSLGTLLTADLDYVRMSSKGLSSFYNRYEETANVGSEQMLGNVNPSAYDIYSVRMDFTKPIGAKSKLETGLKASHVISDNELQFYEMLDEVKQPMSDMSNHFIYRENILAVYGNFNTRLNDKWTLQGGLRAEQTFSEGESVTLDRTTEKKYLDLFPSVFVQQKISDNYQISYNYSRRINRPRYNALNPFFVYLDPYTIAQGNPNLRPEYAHSFEMTQTYKQTYNLVLGYSVSKDLSTEVPVQDGETKTTVFAQRNIDHYRNIRATLVAPVQLHAKWSMFNNVMVAYQKYETTINDLEQVNKQLFFMAQTSNTIKLPKGFTAEVSGTYRGPAVFGLYRAKHMAWADAGIKHSFLNDQLDISLNVTDIFRTQQLIGWADIGLNSTSFDQYRGSQSLRLDLRYRFSKGEKFESKSRNSKLEELNRAN